MDRAYEIARNCQYNGYQRALTSMVSMFFDKKTALVASVNEQLAEELHQPEIKKFKRRKSVQDLKTLSVIDIFTKYAWVKPLKHKKR